MAAQEPDLSYLLAPRGQVRAIGHEDGPEAPENGIARYRSPEGSVRYVMYADGRAVSALQIMTKDGHALRTGRIANVWTAPDARRHGYASALLAQARRDFKVVEHSDDLSQDAKAWKGRVGEPGRVVAREPSGRIAKSDCAHIQNWLYEYLSTDVDPYDFNFAVKDWIEQEEITDDGTPYADPTDVNVEDLSPAQLKAFTKWLKTSGEMELYQREMPYEAPAYLILQARSKLPEGSWLIHFTNANFTRFDRGATLEGLHLSTWNRNKAVAKCSSNLSETQGLHEVVFGFAFDVDRLPKLRDIRNASEKYGKHAVIFQCDCAVEAYHFGDEEHQSVFPLCSEYNLHLVSLDRDGVFIEDENGETRDFGSLNDLVIFLESEPARGRSAKPTRSEREETESLYDELKGASEDVIPVSHDLIEAAAKRTASQFAHHLQSVDWDNPDRWFFDRADNKRKTPEGDFIVVGSPRIEYGYFTPFKHGTIRTVRGRDRIEKVMVTPVLVWDPENRELVLGGGTYGLNPKTGYASIWARVNAGSPYAKDLRDHPEQFTRDFATLLLHEFTHLRDVIRQKDVIDPEKHRHEPGGGYDALVKYFNSPHEVRARMGQTVYEALSVMRHPTLGPELLRRASLQRDNPNEWLIDEALRHSKTWKRGEWLWTPENKARVLRAVYRAFERDGLLVTRRPRLPRTQRSRAAEEGAGTELLLTPAQIEVARDMKAVGFIRMKPTQFLQLTAIMLGYDGNTNSYDEIMRTARPLDEYNARPARIPPYLSVNIEAAPRSPVGQVIEHDGRHRAAAVQKAGGRSMLVAIRLMRNESVVAPRTGVRLADMPRTLIDDGSNVKDRHVEVSLDGAIDLHEERSGARETAASRDLIVPFPAKYLSMVPGDTETTSEPIDVRVYNDGSVVVMRGDVAKKDADALVAVRILETYLPADVWDWYYGQILAGKSPEQINPERYELQYVYDETLATRSPSRRSSRG